MKEPKIRFKGFKGEWEIDKIGNFSTSISGGTPTAGNSAYYGGNIPFIRSGEIHEDKTELSLTEKIEKVCCEIYRASKIEYSDLAINKLKQFESDGKGSYPICIAKTQYSFSDDPKKLIINIKITCLLKLVGLVPLYIPSK